MQIWRDWDQNEKFSSEQLLGDCKGFLGKAGIVSMKNFHNLSYLVSVPRFCAVLSLGRKH